MHVLNIPGVYKTRPAFDGYAGSRAPNVLFIAEAWGKDEDRLHTPLCGYSGREFFRMLFEVYNDIEPELIAKTLSLMGGDAWLYWRDQWLDRAKIGLTNTLAFRPQDNSLKNICKPRKELPKEYNVPAMTRGGYLEPQYLPELTRLYKEITTTAPTLIVALGATALWALKDEFNIGSVRGTVTEAIHPSQRKMISTYHPQAVCYNWSLRPIVTADLMKVRRESKSSAIVRPKRRVIVNPNLSDIDEWFSRPAIIHAVDIETKNKQIEMIGFARQRDDIIVIPFIDFKSPGRSYWRDPMEEMAAWEIIEKKSLANPSIKKLFQNGIFDLSYILPLGIKVINASEDTMLLHHSLHPEMQKGLGFMGSYLTDEPAWKLMRLKSDTQENKRDE